MSADMRHAVVILAVSMVVFTFSATRWEEGTESLLAHTASSSPFEARYAAIVQPIEATELYVQQLEDFNINLVQQEGCVPSYTCGASGTENCCDTAVPYDVTKMAKLSQAKVHRMFGKKAIANMLSPLGKVTHKHVKAAGLTEAAAAAHNATNTTAGKTAKVMSKVLKRFGLAPGSHLSGKAKAVHKAKAKSLARRRTKFVIPPATSEQAHYDKVTGAYHLGHNRRRVGAGFALERRKYHKQEEKAKANARGAHAIPGMLRKEFPRNLWHRKANSTKYEKLSVKDLFSNRSYYRGAGHRGIFRKGKAKGKGKKKMPKREKTIIMIKTMPKGK